MSLKCLTVKELKERLGLNHPEQFRRLLPDLKRYGAFKLPGSTWRMTEEDFENYIKAKKEEAKNNLPS